MQRCMVWQRVYSSNFPMELAIFPDLYKGDLFLEIDRRNSLMLLKESAK